MTILLIEEKMMKALIVIDTQEVIVNQKPFDKEIVNIKRMIDDFKKNNDEVIFTQHVEESTESIFYKENKSIKILDSLISDNAYVYKKSSPSIFKGGKLDEYLKQKHINHLYFVGFNTEFCCMFSAIAAYDRGYKVTVIEDAMGTSNDEDIYEMPGLDINDFVGSVFDWSGVIEVLYISEYFGEEDE